ncbi:unnamed protein product, partial [Phaeothamnion confervicola]
MKSKSFCEDLTEGKFSFPIIHCVRVQPADRRLLHILQQRTGDIDVKKHAVAWMRQCGSIDYTRAATRMLKQEILDDISALGGHAQLSRLIEELDNQL